MDLTSWLAHPIARGALSGLLAAVAIDYLEFRRWTKWQDAAEFDWSLASFRWVKGLIAGAVGSLGVEVIT